MFAVCSRCIDCTGSGSDRRLFNLSTTGYVSMILMNESVTIGPWSGMIMHHMFM